MRAQERPARDDRTGRRCDIWREEWRSERCATGYDSKLLAGLQCAYPGVTAQLAEHVAVGQADSAFVAEWDRLGSTWCCVAASVANGVMRLRSAARHTPPASTTRPTAQVRAEVVALLQDTAAPLLASSARDEVPLCSAADSPGCAVPRDVGVLATPGQSATLVARLPDRRLATCTAVNLLVESFCSSLPARRPQSQRQPSARLE